MINCQLLYHYQQKSEKRGNANTKRFWQHIWKKYSDKNLITRQITMANPATLPESCCKICFADHDRFCRWIFTQQLTIILKVTVQMKHKMIKNMDMILNLPSILNNPTKKQMRVRMTLLMILLILLDIQTEILFFFQGQNDGTTVFPRVSAPQSLFNFEALRCGAYCMGDA